MKRLGSHPFYRKVSPYLPYILFVGIPFVIYVWDRLHTDYPCTAEPHGEWEFLLDHVVDGDTVVDRCGRSLRLIGVDAPELSEPFGVEAMEATQKFLSQGRFRARICALEPYDRYGRVLARIISPKGEDLARFLLSQGLAYPLPIPPCALLYESEDLRLFNQARAQRLGIFAKVPVGKIPAEAGGLYCNEYHTVVGKIRSLRFHKREGLVAELNRMKLKIPEVALGHHPQLGEMIRRSRGRVLEVQGKIRCSKKGVQLTLWSPLLLSLGSRDNTHGR